tara:strand:+ start:729 stop:1529 length:801 start_codon:yes stop_codon:yes gene_type:complete
MFQAILPTTGYVGWRFLERTLETQQAILAESAPIARATDYFREKIGNITSAKDLVADRQLLTVALGAFGLDDDINNKFFIQKVLGDGTTADDALANRLADKSYATLSAAFGFGDPAGPRTGLSNFAESIVTRFEKKQFERAVGEQDNDLRLALNIEDGLKDVTTQTQGENAQWFSMMGNGPLRTIFETALGLPSSIAQIDLDQQLASFKERSEAVLGTDKLADFNGPDKREELLRMFLIRSEAKSFAGMSGNNIALTLMQSAPRFF